MSHLVCFLSLSLSITVCVCALFIEDVLFIALHLFKFMKQARPESLRFTSDRFVSYRVLDEANDSTQ